LPFGQLAIWSTCHLVNLPFGQLAVWSTCHLVNQQKKIFSFFEIITK
jgi:hypothetical protein